MAPRLSLVSHKVFFSVLSPMEVWFLAAVASGLLSYIYIYIYAFSRRFYPKRLALHSSYSFTFNQLLIKCLVGDTSFPAISST